METEIIYYQLWTDEMQYTFEEKFYIHSKLTYGKADEFYFSVNIAKNNKQFLKALKKKMKENYKICDMWLRGLISIYVKRQANRHKTEYKAEYYNEWINNTLHIIQGKNYTEIEKWCNDYKKYIIKYYTDADNKKQPQQILFSEKLLQLLQQNGFIENANDVPLTWTATNKKAGTPNKAALIDLLCILEYPDSIITNIKLLNETFTFSNGKPIKANNLTELTDSKRNLKRPIISEYHTEIQTIVKQSKES